MRNMILRRFSIAIVIGLTAYVLAIVTADAGGGLPQPPVFVDDNPECFYQLTDSGHGVEIVGDDVVEVSVDTRSGRWTYQPPFDLPLRGPGRDPIIGVILDCEEEVPTSTTTTTTTTTISYPTVAPPSTSTTQVPVVEESSTTLPVVTTSTSVPPSTVPPQTPTSPAEPIITVESPPAVPVPGNPTFTG